MLSSPTRPSLTMRTFSSAECCRRVALRISRTVFSALSGTRLLACLIVAPQRGYDEPEILSNAISLFCPTGADGLHQEMAKSGDRVSVDRNGHFLISVLETLIRKLAFPYQWSGLILFLTVIGSSKLFCYKKTIYFTAHDAWQASKNTFSWRRQRPPCFCYLHPASSP